MWAENVCLTKVPTMTVPNTSGAPIDLPTRLGSATQVVFVVAAVPPIVLLALSLTSFSGITGVDQIAFFVVLPMLVAAVFLWMSRRSPASRLSGVLLLVAIGGSAVVAEALLHAVGSIRAARAEPIRGPTIREAVDSIRERGTVAFPTIPGNVLVDRDIVIGVGGEDVHPVTPSPGGETTVLCNETGTLIVYESDRFGFNNPDDVWDYESVEVAMLGDSYTHGLCVSSSDQPAARMAQKASTVNLGARGFGPLLQLAVLREYGHLLRPASVVWVYYEGNDRYDLSREVGREWLTRYLREPSHSQGLADLDASGAYSAWIDEIIAEEFGARQQSLPDLFPGFRSLLTLTTLRQVVGFGVPFPRAGSRIGWLPDVMLAAAQTVAAWDGRITFVYLPAYERFRVLVGEGVPGRGEVMAAAAEAGLQVVDLTPHFEATGTPRQLWASPRGHLSPEGYRLMVEVIAERLGLR